VYRRRGRGGKTSREKTIPDERALNDFIVGEREGGEGGHGRRLDADMSKENVAKERKKVISPTKNPRIEPGGIAGKGKGETGARFFQLKSTTGGGKGEKLISREERDVASTAINES